ncbi:bifunctional riboflavin kinase/FAD synthetase [Pseudoalteromonas sp. XMcav1-K]|uniref:bifunctional riboflavin kinase/FAD synthetase n=1 Tax=Pseudoalteromonas sp. XMcav1-K TaxID=3374372 RepID=UPI0037563A2F
MELIRGIHNIRPKHKGCVLTIGNFDGVHLGHQAVIKGLIQDAKQYQLPSTVMIFEPQPQEYFRKSDAPARLTRLRDKLALLSQLGVERVICIKFNEKFANQFADEFVEHVLVEKLGVAALTVGDDFRFGKGRSGNYQMLQISGASHGFNVKSTASLRQKDCRVSSTAIRLALSQGDIHLANEMLGRTYSVIGKVVHGWKKGRELGFPTANIPLKRQVSPLSGVYCVQVTVASKIYYGVANIGTKPTFNGKRTLLEAHLFDFNCDLYGQIIEVAPVHKLRDEIKFDSFAQLTAQISRDVDDAKAYFDLI